MKAGGYGTAGWAIAGDVVLDLSMLHDTHIEPPSADGPEYVSLRDMTQKEKGNGKSMAGVIGAIVGSMSNSQNSGKRRRSPDAETDVERLPPSNRLVADFLRGSGAPAPWAESGAPSPSIKRRVDPMSEVEHSTRVDGPADPFTMSRQSSSDSANGLSTLGSGSGSGSSTGIWNTPPTSPEEGRNAKSASTEAGAGSVPMDEDGRAASAQKVNGLSEVADALAESAGGVQVLGSTTQSAADASASAAPPSTRLPAQEPVRAPAAQASAISTSTSSASSGPFGYITASPAALASSSSSDPFGYMASSTAAPTPRMQYAQPVYQAHGRAQGPSFAGSSTNPFAQGPSSRLFINDPGLRSGAPAPMPGAPGPPTSTFMPSVRRAALPLRCDYLTCVFFLRRRRRRCTRTRTSRSARA